MCRARRDTLGDVALCRRQAPRAALSGQGAVLSPGPVRCGGIGVQSSRPSPAPAKCPTVAQESAGPAGPAAVLG